MTERKAQVLKMQQILENINGGRSLLANAAGFLCVAGLLGVSDLFCNLMLQTDLVYVLRVLLIVVAIYYFVPFLILWVLRGSKA